MGKDRDGGPLSRSQEPLVFPDDAKTIAKANRRSPALSDPYFAVGELRTPALAATVTVLRPKVEPTTRDEALELLEGLVHEIRSGVVDPTHLILGWGETDTLDGVPATNYVWDTVGINRFELIGHLQAYGVKLANGEGE